MMTFCLDISTKAEVLRRNKELHVQLLLGAVKPTLQSIVAKEVELGITDLNAEKPTKGRKFKNEWEAKYTSTARTLLRNMWLLDYISQLFGTLNKNRTAKMSDVAKESYSQTLGNHHPWIVR